MEIPSDYSKCIMTGRQATVPFYAEMSLLLRYRAFLSALTDLQLHITQEVTAGRLASGRGGCASDFGSAYKYAGKYPWRHTTGFASFIMPGIVVLILQQSMALGICLIGGTAAERRRRNAPSLQHRHGQQWADGHYIGQGVVLCGVLYPCDDIHIALYTHLVRPSAYRESCGLSAAYDAFPAGIGFLRDNAGQPDEAKGGRLYLHSVHIGGVPFPVRA